MEKAIFGAELDSLNWEAARVLLALQPQDQLSIFKQRFGAANRRPRSKQNPEISLEGRKHRGAKDVVIFGRCGKVQLIM